MSGNIRLIDQRVRMATRGFETIRGVVVASPVGGIASVRVAGSVLPAILPRIPGLTLTAGMVVELERPRGVGGQLHIVRVLGR